jgi:ribosome recycling factor
MLQDLYKKTKDAMEGSLKAFTNELKRVRAGRASVTLLDPIRVNYYGSPTPVTQVASISIPESDLIVIQPWDVSILSEITKSIQKSDLGINPVNDGKVVRLKLPPMTEERRKDLVKQVKKLGEDAKIAIRNQRRDANEAVKKALKGKEISEDESKDGQDHVQKLTDEYVHKVDQTAVEKEKEITTL